MESQQALFQCIADKGTIPKSVSRGTVAAQWPYWTTITVNKGTHLHSMGFSHQGQVKLHAEEAAYLVARNALVVDNMDFEGFCEIMYEAGDGFINYDKYQVYAYLKRLGFIVMRAAKDDVTRAAIDSSSGSCSSSVLKWLYSKRSMDNPLLWDYKCRNYSKKKVKRKEKAYGILFKNRGRVFYAEDCAIH